jgi:hypothetical protein
MGTLRVTQIETFRARRHTRRAGRIARHCQNDDAHDPYLASPPNATLLAPVEDGPEEHDEARNIGIA